MDLQESDTQVLGVLVKGLTAEDMDRLDYFEGGVSLPVASGSPI